MNIVEELLEEYLRTSAGEEREFAARHRSLPLDRRWTGTIFLTTTGDFLFRDETGQRPAVTPETDVANQLVALVSAAERDPIFVNLLPARSAPWEDCQECGGTGRLAIQNGSWVYCGMCNGVGWRSQLAVPLALPESSRVDYPRFDDALARLAAFAVSRGMPRELLFVSRSNALFIERGGFYLHLPEPIAAKRRARRTYEAVARRRLGVAVEGAGIVRGRLAVAVYGPIDDDEAVRRMFPDGLKLSLPHNPRRAIPVGAMTGILQRRLRRYGSMT